MSVAHVYLLFDGSVYYGTGHYAVVPVRGYLSAHGTLEAAQANAQLRVVEGPLTWRQASAAQWDTLDGTHVVVREAVQ